jgi:hypothetical protein
MVVGDDDLGAVELGQQVMGHEVARPIVAVRIAGRRTRSRSLIVIPGVTIRKPRENLRGLADRTAFRVCHAISMAMTVVFPARVASLRAIASDQGWLRTLRLHPAGR